MAKPSAVRLMTEAVFKAKAATQDAIIAAYIQRVASLETIAGLAPGQVSDATMSSIATNPLTNFAKYLLANFAQAIGAPVTVEKYGAKGDGVTDDTAAIQAAIDAESAGGATQSVLTLSRGRNYLVSGTLRMNIGKVTLRGYRSRITYTGAGVLLQLVGAANFSSHGQPVLQGVSLFGPGIDTTSTAIKTNTDDAKAIGSYTAGHPFQNVLIEGFGIGIQYGLLSWGNTLRSCLINRCGVGFLVPVGMDSTMGERLAFDDTIIAECHTAAEVRSGSVELNFTNCSIDYNRTALKSNRNSHFVNCHIEVNAARWNDGLGHFQHTSASASTDFTGTTFVISDIYTEVFEPYNAGTLADIYLRSDRFIFHDGCRWSLTWAAVFTSRLAGFPHRRLVNEIAGNRNLRRGVFGHQFIAGVPEPIFGGSLSPGRNQAGLALPTTVLTVSGGDAPTSSSVVDDPNANVPQSYRTIVASASSTGVHSIVAKTDVRVDAADAGKRLAVRQKCDFTVVGSDAEFTVYARALAADGTTLHSMEAWPGFTPVAAGSTAGVELWKGYASAIIPVGCVRIEMEVQLRKTRSGDSWNLYPPLVNIV